MNIEIERVSDHRSNIAVDVIDTARNNFDSHEYLNTVKTMDDEQFCDNYNECTNRYRLKQYCFVGDAFRRVGKPLIGDEKLLVKTIIDAIVFSFRGLTF